MGGEPGLCVAPSPRAEVACGQPQRPPGGPTWEAAGRRLEHRGRLCGGLRVSWPRAGGQRLSVGATGPPLIAAPSPAHAVSVHLKPVVLGGRCRQAAGHGFTIKGAFSVLPERFCPQPQGRCVSISQGKERSPEMLSSFRSHTAPRGGVRSLEPVAQTPRAVYQGLHGPRVTGTPSRGLGPSLTELLGNR